MVEKIKKGRFVFMFKMCVSCWRIVIFRKFSYKKWEKVFKVFRRLLLVFIINDLMLIDLVKEVIIIFNKRSFGYFVRF